MVTICGTHMGVRNLASFSQGISRCRVGDLGLNLGTIRTSSGETAV